MNKREYIITRLVTFENFKFENENSLYFIKDG